MAKGKCPRQGSLELEGLAVSLSATTGRLPPGQNVKTRFGRLSCSHLEFTLRKSFMLVGRDRKVGRRQRRTVHVGRIAQQLGLGDQVRPAVLGNRRQRPTPSACGARLRTTPG